jgi:hypothetical protein
MNKNKILFAPKYLILIAFCLFFIPQFANAAVSLSEVCFPGVECDALQDYYNDDCRKRINTLADCAPANAFSCNNGCYTKATGSKLYCSDPDYAYKTDTSGKKICGLVDDGDWVVSGNDIYNANTGNVGIGETNPAASLEISDDVGGKPLIIAGDSYADATGEYSVAIGYEAQATNDHAFAIGNGASATGWGSSAFGTRAYATGLGAVALGIDAYAKNEADVAMGDESEASGGWSTAIGLYSDATGYTSTSLGYQSNATGQAAVAIGNVTASGHTSKAFGSSVIATGLRSMALGTAITVSGTNSVGVGLGCGLQPTVSQSGVMSVMCGNVGIGTVSPTALLDVNNQLRVESGGRVDLSGGYNSGGGCTVFPDGNTQCSANISAIGGGLRGDSVYFAPGSAPGNNNGQMYYDSGMNRFRCYENGSWKNCTEDGDWTVSGGNVYRTSSGYVGIGTATPGSNLHVSQTPGVQFGDVDVAINHNSSTSHGSLTFMQGWNGSSYTLNSSITACGSSSTAGNCNPQELQIYNGGGDIAFRLNSYERMRITNGGLVGIGTNNPNASLTVVGGANIGAFNNPSGSYAIATGWFSTASGNDSVAMGQYAYAKGNQAVAMGSSSNAYGTQSVAIGMNNVTGCSSGSYCSGGATNGENNDGAWAVALGNTNTAIGRAAVAIGGRNKALGYNAFSVGLDNVATDDMSVAMGQLSQSRAELAIAMGYKAYASKRGAVAIGYDARATGSYATALGYSTSSVDTGSFAAGYDTYANGIGSTTLGYKSTTSSNYATAIGYRSEATYTAATSIGSYMDFAGSYGVGIGLGSAYKYVYSPGNLIVKGGKVGIETSSPSSTLTVVGTAAKTGGGSWSSTSDIRLKDVKGDYKKGLEEILTLKPVNFRYKEDNPRELPSDEDYIGFIAQDVEEVFPETVTEAEDGYLDFNMHAVNVAAINAIKELKAEKDAEILELKEKIKELEAK